MAIKPILSSFAVALMVVGLLLSCLGTVFGQSMPTPPVPQFTVDLIDSSYDTQPTSTIDPYTGQTVTQPSQHIEERTIQLKIKQIAFTPFEIENNSMTFIVNLHYNVRWKGHFDNESAWRELYIPIRGYAVGEKVGDDYVVSYKGQYTVSEGLKLGDYRFGDLFPVGAKIDFQVQALIGYIHHVVVPGPFSGDVFEGEKSDWSATQTLTLSDASTVAATPAPSVSQHQDTPSAENQSANSASDLDWLQVATLALLVVIAVLLALAVFYLRKKSSINSPIRAR